MSLYNKYRPRILRDVIGQPDAVAFCVDKLRNGSWPRFVLFAGCSGSGKTTVARIVGSRLITGETMSDAFPDDCVDYHEEDVATSRGIDFVRDFQDACNRAPVLGRCCVYVLDEVHGLTKDACDAMLKLTEQREGRTHIIGCTTDVDKLPKTLRSRGVIVPFQSITHSVLIPRICAVYKSETGGELEQDIADHIATASEGSLREALSILEFAISSKSSLDALRRNYKAPEETAPFRLVNALLSRSKWPTLASIIEGLPPDTQYEGLRRQIRTVVSNKALKTANANWHGIVLMAFDKPYFDSGKSGLIQSCLQAASALGNK